MMFRASGAAALSAVLAAVLFGATGCGAAAGGDSGTDGTDVVRVGETDGMPAAFLRFGEEQGIFAEHGIRLEIDASAGGAAAVPALVGGNLDVAGSNVVSGLLAGHQGLPVRIIAPGTFATEDPERDFSAVVVSEGSGIDGPEDLAGASIAVNTLQNIGDISIVAALQEQGVDTSDIDFTEIGFPQMLPAVQSGRVDAAWVIEPFLSIGQQQGLRPVLRPYAEAREGLQVGCFLTTEDFLAENPEKAAAFREAVADVAAFVTEHPEEFRAALPELEEMDPALADAMVLPSYRDRVDPDSLRFVADRMLASGFTDEEIDVDSLIATPRSTPGRGDE
ncbi:ABC transporter substrate-binding protein [Streptomyces sp. B6B3]|uniref:ABC transporter substrate-binding protein n=1 Tax=Streptomyces sp. B6B3 TaxID=3153570 RepID=UPI00325DB947